MMGKSYQPKTNRSRRKMQKLNAEAVTIELADGKAAMAALAFIVPSGPKLAFIRFQVYEQDGASPCPFGKPV